MKKIKPLISCLLLFSLYACSLFSQTKISYSGSPTYSLVERTDLMRYDNNKYVGLVSREVRSFITPLSQKNGYLYEGNFFVHQDTLRNSSPAAQGIHDSILSVFRISSDGQLTMVEDHGYPSFRSFPSYPQRAMTVGERWQAKAERAVDPLNKGIVTKMPIYVEYTYLGDEIFNNQAVYKISAQWATRYGMGSGTSYIDWGGDRELQKASGSHKAMILVSKASGAALVIRDNVDEVFLYSDGKEIHLRGTINLFTEYPPSLDRDRLLPALRRYAMINDEEAVRLARKDDEKVLPASVNSSEVPDTSDSLLAMTEEKVQDDTLLSDYSKASDGEYFYDDTRFAAEGRNSLPEYEAFDEMADLSQKPEISKDRIEEKNEIAIKVDQTPAGIRLTIQDLQFEPNSANLLPGEEKRLDNIASVLKEASLSQFLIEGHTARVGQEDGEMELSLDRAHAIAQALSKRGIQAGRFICKGSGGKKPVADNSTEEGRARNRRVEITILE